jgi:hypothetical protein
MQNCLGSKEKLGIVLFLCYSAPVGNGLLRGKRPWTLAEGLIWNGGHSGEWRQHSDNSNQMLTDESKRPG